MLPLATTTTMLRMRLLSLVTAALLLGFSIALQAGTVAPAWSVEITPDSELFPVLDLSQMPPKSAPAPGGGNGLVLVRVKGDATRRHVRLEIETAGLRKAAVVETGLDRGATLELRPRLDWDIAHLRALKAPSRQIVRITLERSGLATEVRDVEVRVHPLDDALYYVHEGRDRIDLGWVFAAYVDPDDPIVAAIVADARAFDAEFDTGSAGDANANVRKARAIWAALMRHGLSYAAGDPALSRGPTLYSQRVRLVADVWRERRANCLEGSVLIASVLEHIGIPAFIVLVPGHAFVGYRADGRADGDHVELLETTVLGERTGAGGERAEDSGAIALNFEAARSAGRARWRRVSNRFDRRHAPDYALIDIGTARSYGIIPLGAHGENGGAERASPTAAAGLSRKSSSQ